MTTPVIVSVTPSARTTNGTSHPIALPAVVDAGDILLALVSFDGQPTVTWDNTTAGAWTLLHDTQHATTIKMVAYWKIADGTEDGKTVAVTTSVSEQSVGAVFRVTGATSVEAGVAVTKNSGTSCDPPNLAPSWGAKETLWIAGVGINNDAAVTVSDIASYTATVASSSSNTGGTTLGYASRAKYGSSEDPAAFVSSISSQSIQNTYAFNPTESVVQSGGTAAGTSTAPGSAQATGQSAGTAAGGSTAPGSGVTVATSSGTAAGGSTAEGLGDSDTPGYEATGLAQGGSTAPGMGGAVATGRGSTTGAGAAPGQGGSIAQSGGLAYGAAAAPGLGRYGGLVPPEDGGPLLYPLTPNWRESVDVSWSFFTEIITSDSGREQRRALRDEPRKDIQFLSLREFDLLRAFERILKTEQNNILLLPEFTEKVICGGLEPTEQQTTFTGDQPEWLVAGAVVALVEMRRSALRTILAVENNTVVFVETDEETWSPGTRICPAHEGRFLAPITVRLAAQEVGELTVGFSVEPGTEEYDPGAVDPTRIFGNREVFLWQPNWDAPVNIDYEFPVTVVDYGIGRRSAFKHVLFDSQVFQAGFVQRSAAEVKAIRQFFCRVQGQRGEFYVPTWKNDVEPLYPLYAGDDTLTVEGTALAEIYNGDPVHAALAIRYGDGRVLLRHVTSITENTGNSVFSLHLPWGFDLPLADIVSVSWALVCRFASDELLVEWITDEVAQTQLNLRTLEALEGEEVTSELDETAQWVLDTYGWEFLSTLYNSLHPAVNVQYPAAFGV